MKRVLSIALIFSNVVLLFPQDIPPDPIWHTFYRTIGNQRFDWKENIYFKRSKNQIGGDRLTGQLISIKLNQKLDPMTGFTSQVVFRPWDKLEASRFLGASKTNDGKYYIFDAKDIKKIEIVITWKYVAKNKLRLSPTRTADVVGAGGSGGRIVKELYSDEIQREYLGRGEVEKIIDNGIKELYQNYLDKVESIKTTLRIGYGVTCIFLLLALFSGP